MEIGKQMNLLRRNEPDTGTASGGIDEQALAATTIRDLVAAYPATMEILAPLGIDLCCGGAHPLGEALDLHGIARADVLPSVARLTAAHARG
jgi:iron-sulfur cluster repair protein YtfE (RIC family)